MPIAYQLFGLFEVRRTLGRWGDNSPQAAYEGLVDWSGEAPGIIREGLYGRPGPERLTGALYDTMQALPPERTPTGGRAMAGSNQPYSLRLEKGFVGTDSIGRSYDQQPYPWLEPKVPQLQQRAHQLVTARIKKMLES